MLQVVSIIIPVYNKAYALEHTLKSIQNQTFKDFEVLLVDDGSTDGSYEICDQFHSADNRFIAIHKENGGASSARNLGLERMRGKYVFFCDADDELPKDAILSLVTAQKNSNAELVIGGFAYKNIKTGHMASPYTYDRTDLIFTTKDFKNYADVLWRENNMLTSCSRLYLADIIKQNHIKFNESLIVLEDFDFVLTYMKHIKKIHSIPSFTYYQLLGYGVDSYRAKADYIDDVKKVYESFVQYLLSHNISPSTDIMKELYMVVTEDLKRISLITTSGFKLSINRYRRSREILSYCCVQQALNNVVWDKQTQHLIDNYGIKKWLSGFAVRIDKINSDFSTVKSENSYFFAVLWKLKHYLKIYI